MFTTYVGMLGNVFAPIAGVLIADYIFVKRMKIDLVALFEPNGPYWYWKGVNPVAVAWTAVRRCRVCSRRTEASATAGSCRPISHGEGKVVARVDGGARFAAMGT